MMSVSPARLILFFLYSLLWFSGESQKNATPVDKWVDLLSTKKDLGLEKFTTVLNQITTLDSAVQCHALENLETAGPKENKRFVIKLDLIKWNLSLANTVCSFNRSTESLLKEALQLAYEVEDPYLVAVLNEKLMDDYTRTGKTGLAVMQGLIAKEMSASLGEQHFPGLALSCYTLGHELYLSREYALAIPVFKQAIKGFSYPDLNLVDTLNMYYKMNSWNTLGLSFKKLEHYDSAFIAFHEALRIAEVC